MCFDGIDSGADSVGGGGSCAKVPIQTREVAALDDEGKPPRAKSDS